MVTIPHVRASHVSSPVVQNDWIVHWEVTQNDGIRIYNVAYKGVLFLRDARVPGVIVRYFGGGCFFYDEFLSIWIQHANIFVEDLNGGPLDPTDQGFQIRGDYDVPGYLYQQIWRFHQDGVFLPLVEVGGGGCQDRHVYEVRWRFDFAITEDNRNTFHQYSNGGWRPVREEGEIDDIGERDASNMFTNWRVSSGRRAYYFSSYDTPEGTWAPGLALVVQKHSGENENSQIPGIVNPYIYRGNIVYDKNANGFYDPAEPVVTGVVGPPFGTLLEDDPRVKYVDADNNNIWNSTSGNPEAVIYDTNGNGQYDPGELAMYGSPPAARTALKDDSKIKQTPRESVWRKDLVVWYISQHFHDPAIQYTFEVPVLTGLIFYPSGY